MAQLKAIDWLSLCIISIIVAVAAGGVNKDICMKNIPQPQSKDFPNIPNNFRADFTWNMHTVNTSFFTQELFSDNLNIGVMVIENLMGPGIRSKLYTYADTNEFVFIDNYDGSYGGNCTVGELNYNDFAFPFRSINGHDKLVSGKDVLLLGGTSAVMDYLGNDTIDDIDVDVWNACIYIKDTDMTLDATYYFTANNTGRAGRSWRTASGMSSVIKRIHVRQDNSKGKAFSESTYEYAYFSDDLLGEESTLKYFEPPLGAYCKGRKSSKPLPTVPDYFSMAMELHDPQQDLLIYSDEWYDFTANLSRVDFNSIQDRSNKSEPLTTINDYETGISYKIYKYSEKCEIGTIDAYGLDDELLPGSTPDKKLVRIRTPKEFFNFDDTEDYPWIYSGTHTVRMVECEVWISKRPYPTKTSNVMAYWEWYFTSSQWILSNGDVIENLEPFHMVVTVPDLNYQVTEFNIYMFNQEPPSDHIFDISSCFDMHKQSRSFEFVMTADVKRFNLDSNMGMLKYWTIAAIEAYAGVRSLRVHGMEFEFDETKVFTRFTLLGAPTLKGDVPSPIEQLTLDEAEGYLNRSIMSGKFLVYYLTESGKETQFQVDKESFVRSIHTAHGSDSVYYIIDDDGRAVTVTPTTAAANNTNSSTTAALPPTPLVVTAEPAIKNPDVSSGGVAAIAIVLLLVGIAAIAIPFYIVSAKRKKNYDSGRSQLTMSDLHE